MNSFVYNIPVKIYFGQNQLCHLGEEITNYGKKILLCYGGGSIKKIGLYDKVIGELEKEGVEIFELSGIAPNPRIDSVREGAAICKKENIDAILAVGGGSVIDCAKVIGAAAYYDGDPWDFLTGDAFPEKALPLLTVLTISATGSEMDNGAVITNLETKDKKDFVAPCMLPKVSFLDPTNTYTVSKYQTACGAADILSHIMEVYFTNEKDLEMLDSYMEALMRTVIKFTPIALAEPENYEARANLMWTSSWAINESINGGKSPAWTCHAIEHEVSAIYDIAHGHGLAIITPRWLEYILDETTVAKMYQFGTNVFGIDGSLGEMEVAKKAIEAYSYFLFNTCGLDSKFSEIGIGEENFDVMAEKCCHGGIMNGFKDLSKQDVVNIFKMCL